MKTLLLETMNVKQFEQITIQLNNHDIDYTYRMEDILAKNPFDTAMRSRTPDFTKHAKNRYRIYVDKKDLDQAKTLLHQYRRITAVYKTERIPLYHRNPICFFLLFASAIRLYPSTIFSFSPFTMERASFISTSFSRSDGSCASTPGMTMHFRFAAS